MIKTLLLFSLFAFRLSLFADTAYADVSCQPIYGGGETCVTRSNIFIDKKILNPQTNKMVDNLGINDPKYQPEFITTFQISVTNIGSSDISKIQVKDIFPRHVDFSAGQGKFDSQTRTLTLEIDTLKPNETKTFFVLGRIDDQNKIPLDQGIVCVVNQAIAVSMDSQSEVSQDNSQFCIEKKVLGAQAPKGGFPVFPSQQILMTPQTGPESLVLLSLIPTVMAGFALRKLSSRVRKEQN